MRLTFTDEAILRMRERRIMTREVEAVISSGEILREYPDDRPYPSCLVLGWVDERPLHVVYAVNAEGQERIVITTYQPDPALWDAEFKKRLDR
jgi:hypothetical protein